MIRPASPHETPALVALGVATGLFRPDEADLLLCSVLDDLHAGRLGAGHSAFVWADDHQRPPAGWVYFSPDAHAEGVWELWWIGVDPTRQGRGLGDALLRFVEGRVREAGGRTLLISTSSLPPLERTRRFYAKRGYAACGRIPDFYGDGDDKVTFAKRVAAPPARPRGTPAPAGEVRPAREHDLRDLVRLAARLGRQHEAYDGRRFELAASAQPESVEGAYERLFAGALRSPDARVLVATAEPGVVGYAFARLEPASFLDLSAESGWVHDVYLEEAYRGGGLGRRLLERAARELEAMGARRLRLSVSPHNESALRAFAALGFRHTLIECQRDPAFG